MRHPREKAPGQPQRGLLSKSGWGGAVGRKSAGPVQGAWLEDPPSPPESLAPGAPSPPQSQAQGHTLGESLTLHTSEVTGSR